MNTKNHFETQVLCPSVGDYRYDAVTQPKMMQRNPEVLGKARSGNAKLQVLLDSLC